MAKENVARKTADKFYHLSVEVLKTLSEPAEGLTIGEAQHVGNIVSRTARYMLKAQGALESIGNTTNFLNERWNEENNR